MKLFSLLLVTILLSCSSNDPDDFSKAIESYYKNNLSEAKSLLLEYNTQNPSDSDALSYLAEIYRRLGDVDSSEVLAEEALLIDSCNTFALHIIAVVNQIPIWHDNRLDSDIAWDHLNKAIACDPLDPNIWLTLWGESLIRGKYELMEKSISKIYESKILTKANLAFGRWLLGNLPDSSILITNGDMDTYPLLVLQQVKGFRDDVVVIERGMLGSSNFLRYLKSRFNVPLPVEDILLDEYVKIDSARENDPILDSLVLEYWRKLVVSNKLRRPLTISVTVEKTFYESYSDHLIYSGAYFLMKDEIVRNKVNVEKVKKGVYNIAPDEFSGEWSSPKDYSPVRFVYNKYLVGNITESAVFGARELIRLEKYDEAKQMLKWAADFEKTTELGQVFSESIRELEGNIE